MIHGYISLSGLNSFLIVQNFANSAHPTQKPQTLTASKTKYEKFGSKILIPHQKNRYFGALIFSEREFFDP